MLMSYEEAWNESLKFIKDYYFEIFGKNENNKIILYDDYQQNCAGSFFEDVKNGLNAMDCLLLCARKYKNVLSSMIDKHLEYNEHYILVGDIYSKIEMENVGDCYDL